MGLRQPLVKAPNLDELANDDILFQNHYANTTDVRDEFTDLSGEDAHQSLMLEYAERPLSRRQVDTEHELTDT